MKIVISTFILFILLSFVSCTDDHCNFETDSLLKMEFFVRDTNLTKINFIDSLSIYSTEWPDSIYYSLEGTKTDSSLTFMLSPEFDISKIIITSKEAALNDTLTFYYQREFILLSPECGFVVDFTIDSINPTWNYIDSLKIINSEITTDKNGLIQIYF